MSSIWNWPGSRWWRVDFHTHTPGSYDFGSATDRQTPDWSRWLQTARTAGLDAVVVTDHNTGEGVGGIQSVGDATPIVFPGLELTANDGAHLLLVLDPACSKAHVEEILAKADVAVDTRGTATARSSLSVEQILDLENDRVVLYLAAHVNGPKGLLEHNGQQRLAELRHPKLIAVEVDPNLPVDDSYLDGRRPEIGRKLARVFGSDSHDFAQAGRRFTWTKMTRPNAEGLRLALLDGEASLRPTQAPDTFDPNAHADCVIESIAIESAKYLGRPTPFTVNFNPWLNAVIGGRGTGKSTIIDLLRVALRREAELGSSDTALREAFNKRLRVPVNRRDEGLLTPDTSVEVIYRKDGERFAICWDHGGTSAAIARINGDRREIEHGDIRERFPVRIYSQKQLFDLASEPNALLTVVDDSSAVHGAETRRQLNEAEAKYLAYRAEARALLTQALELPARRATLGDVRRKLELFQRGSNSKVLSDYRIRRNQNDAWSIIQATPFEKLDELERMANNLNLPELDNESLGDDAEAALKRMRAARHQILSELKDSLRATTAAARAQLAALESDPDVEKWRAALAESEKAYGEISAELTAAGIQNPDEYRELLERATALEQQIAALEKQKQTADDRNQDAEAELSRYRKLRAELTDRRKNFAAATSSDLVKVVIHESANREDLEQFIRDLLGIERFDDDHRSLREQMEPANGEPWSFDRLDELTSSLSKFLSDPDQRWASKDRRFEAQLRKIQPERIDRFALYLPEDAVDVSFKDPRNPAAPWQQLAQGSPGQQTAALLAFVLGYGSEPIILDQPEDDLDNVLIYQLLVRRLRETKPTRQIIVVTHNPNIVVHGDAELVLSLEARGGQSQIEFSGGLQEQKARDEVCRVMEGGREAFETRYRRIMPSDIR